jgi:hypothetical protein
VAVDGALVGWTAVVAGEEVAGLLETFEAWPDMGSPSALAEDVSLTHGLVCDSDDCELMSGSPLESDCFDLVFRRVSFIFPVSLSLAISSTELCLA